MYKIILIQIVILLVLQYNGIDREHVHIFIAKGLY